MPQGCLDKLLPDPMKDKSLKTNMQLVKAADFPAHRFIFVKISCMNC